MVGIKVTLPQLLSRPSSKSRKQDTAPSTTFGVINRTASASSSSGGGSPQPSTGPSSVDEGSVSPLLVPTSTAPAGDRSKGERRPSLIGLGAAIRRTVTASTPITSPNISPAPSGTNTPRTISDGPLPPAASARTSPVLAGKMGPPPAKPLKRSPKSGAVPLHTASQTSAVLPHSHSQPAASRLGALGQSLRGSTKGTPAAGTPHVHGSQTPVGAAPARGPAIPALEESYVAKVSQRLGDAINRVFVPAAHGHGAGAGADLVLGGRLAPKVDRAKDAADMIVNELAAAMRDQYLLKVIIRSSVLKSLSLFIGRLSALLVVSSPLEFPLPAVLPESLRLNLAIVRAAHAMSVGLREAGRLHGAPAFVGETLSPWAAKCEEVTNRVMNPILAAVRVETARITVQAQLPPSPTEVKAPASGAATPTLASMAHLPTASQLRSLSLPLSRSASPAPAMPIGPAWLTELGAVLEGFGRLVKSMDCGATGDRWIVQIGTCSTWKGMLALSARVVDSDTTPAHTVPVGKAALFGASAKLKIAQTNTPPPLPPARPTELYPAPASRASSHSRADIGRGVSPARGLTLQSPRERSLHRVVAELEMFESRIRSYVTYLSSPIAPPAPWVDACLSPACELCRIGRGFDPESASDEEDDASPYGLAQGAMREALQTLSAMIVVAMATSQPRLVKEALEARHVAKHAPVKAPTEALTPSMMFATNAVHNTPSAPAPQSKACPTLLSALPEVPPLLLQQLLVARLPRTLSFRQPHDLFERSFPSYAAELRGFAQGEEWEDELAFEVGAELVRVRGEVRELTEVEWEGLEVLELALREVEGRD